MTCCPNCSDFPPENRSETDRKLARNCPETVPKLLRREMLSTPTEFLNECHKIVPAHTTSNNPKPNPIPMIEIDLQVDWKIQFISAKPTRQTEILETNIFLYSSPRQEKIYFQNGEKNSLAMTRRRETRPTRPEFNHQENHRRP